MVVPILVTSLGLTMLYSAVTTLLLLPSPSTAMALTTVLLSTVMGLVYLLLLSEGSEPSVV